MKERGGNIGARIQIRSDGAASGMARLTLAMSRSSRIIFFAMISALQCRRAFTRRASSHGVSLAGDDEGAIGLYRPATSPRCGRAYQADDDHDYALMLDADDFHCLLCAPRSPKCRRAISLSR